MNNQRMAGKLLVVVGVILFIIGMNASHSAADRWSDFFTGHFTDSTVWYIVVGVAAAIGGLGMMTVGGRRFAA
jgi:hypothetical protein